MSDDLQAALNRTHELLPDRQGGRMRARSYSQQRARGAKLPSGVIQTMLVARAMDGHNETAERLGVSPQHLHIACKEWTVAWGLHDVYRDYALWWDSCHPRRTA
jgi:hypothetical protein